jgi:hypothetical protein
VPKVAGNCEACAARVRTILALAERLRRLIESLGPRAAAALDRLDALTVPIHQLD